MMGDCAAQCAEGGGDGTPLVPASKFFESCSRNVMAVGRTGGRSAYITRRAGVGCGACNAAPVPAPGGTAQYLADRCH